MRKIRLVLVAISLLALVTGCGDKGGFSLKSATPTPIPFPTTPQSAAGELSQQSPQPVITGGEKIEEDGPFTMSFVGDVMCDDQMWNNYVNADNNILGVLSEPVLDRFINSDIMVANHEYCCTDLDDSYKLTFQKWIERAKVRNEVMFGEMGIDVASVANNHMFDYSRDGFMETIDRLKEMKIKVIGGGADVNEAASAQIVKVGKKSVAFFAANSVITDVDWIATDTKSGQVGLYGWSDSYQKMLENIKTAKEENDLVVVLLHFGTEKTNVMNKDQIYYAHEVIDAGADIIIGSHAHVLQGIEYYGDGVIFYSLGNFLFSNYQSDTMVVTVTVETDGSYSMNILPCSSYLLRTEDTTSSAVFDILNEYSINASVDAEGNVSKTDTVKDVALTHPPTPTPVPEATN